ncbi:GM21433 [Drosophila sechellia]|uniref:GM21433 n=2 Tax=Drosophila sechellia TaxID=7238 RepID=B4HPY2_DROSE|nr:GM21433 [Drosophila sechellia]
MESVASDVVPAKESGGFTSHSVHLSAGPSQFTVRALKMQGSTMLIINPKGSEVFEELAVAMPSRNPASSQSVSSTILGGHGQTDSSVLAAKLSKRYCRQFYVSLNLKLDRLMGPLFEKTLVTYMQDHLEHFA